MPNEFVEILSNFLHLKNRSILLDQYNAFNAKHGPMTNECAQQFGIPLDENVMLHPHEAQQVLKFSKIIPFTFFISRL